MYLQLLPVFIVTLLFNFQFSPELVIVSNGYDAVIGDIEVRKTLTLSQSLRRFDIHDNIHGVLIFAPFYTCGKICCIKTKKIGITREF